MYEHVYIRHMQNGKPCHKHQLVHKIMGALFCHGCCLHSYRVTQTTRTDKTEKNMATQSRRRLITVLCKLIMLLCDVRFV